LETVEGASCKSSAIWQTHNWPRVKAIRARTRLSSARALVMASTSRMESPLWLFRQITKCTWASCPLSSEFWAPELLQLGFEISERTVSRYLRHLSPADDTRNRCSAFLCNHRDVIAAMDFFTVPALTFRVLYCFFVIEHGRRKIVHFNVTEHPTGPCADSRVNCLSLPPYRILATHSL